MLDIRRLASPDVPLAAAIVRSLPDHFTSDVPGLIERDAARHDGWVITDSGTVAGFAIASRRPPGSAEILWIAVDPARRGQGLGTALLDRVLGELSAAGVSVVEAKTLDASADYPPYEATRAFWEHIGFVHIDTIDPLPDWPPGTPRPSMSRPFGRRDDQRRIVTVSAGGAPGAGVEPFSVAVDPAVIGGPGRMNDRASCH